MERLCAELEGQSVDVAPFGSPLPEGIGCIWEDPRKIHRVVARFTSSLPSKLRLRLEYWGSRWPHQRLPENREPGGGDVGWWELGNWYHGDWRVGDVEETRDDDTVTFVFRPVNASEFPDLRDYAARFRYTLKIRITSDDPLPPVEAVRAYTDSTWKSKQVRVVWKDSVETAPVFDTYNGILGDFGRSDDQVFRIEVLTTESEDPNSFDRTLLSIREPEPVTVAIDNLRDGPLFLPSMGIAFLSGDDARSYSDLDREWKAGNGKTLRERVAEHPEQSWKAAWESMPVKRSLIYLPLGNDGGRHRFQLGADGSLTYRTNNHFLEVRPGKDTPLLRSDGALLRVSFGMSDRPASRSLWEKDVPIGVSTWEKDGLIIGQEAFATPLHGASDDGAPPAGDATTVCMLRFRFTNRSDQPKNAVLPITVTAGDKTQRLEFDADGYLRSGGRLRGYGKFEDGGAFHAVEGDETEARWTKRLEPGASCTVTLVIPYLALEAEEDRRSLAALDFDRERDAVAAGWNLRLDAGMRLTTPEAALNEFHRAHAAHLLINCERDTEGDRRFARVGSFSYGAYGNESCMMVVDLDRRGYHEEARECLEAWLHYQGTVDLPGDFSTRDGILYGAGGYESGGYNQHHGWILWCLAEHYRFTRDREWLNRAAPGMLKAAEWIIGERRRTAGRADLAKGLLPAGSLEDIGDWWPWLSTNCYTWRGLDAAAGAFESIDHPEAARLRREADAYHAGLIGAFTAARNRSPVIRLRNGTAVPHFPSYVYRRGRSFGWICETLEGAIHLLISGALAPDSPEASMILDDYEDNLFLSNQYGYTLDDFEKHWFNRGGMSMQSCLLLDAEPYLARDEVKSALRAIFNAIAVGYFPDVRMITEHALPEMGDWRGDHYKSSDEANATGWLRYLFVREEGDILRIGQAIPRNWLRSGNRCGVERAATHFGPMSVIYRAEDRTVTAELNGPRRNPPKSIRVRFRRPSDIPFRSVEVNGSPWSRWEGDEVILPGDVGEATVTVR